MGLSHSHLHTAIGGGGVFCSTCLFHGERSGGFTGSFPTIWLRKNNFLINCSTKPVFIGGQVIPKAKELKTPTNPLSPKEHVTMKLDVNSVGLVDKMVC